MRLLFSPVPRIACTALSCLPAVLEQPLVERIPVFDDVGTVYATEVHPTEGALLVLFAAILIRLLRHSKTGEEGASR